MSKIIISGAQGVGKTTLINYFKEKGYNTIDSISHKLADQGVKINELSDIDSQKIMFDAYKKALSTRKDFISDRGLFDVIAYTYYVAAKNNIGQKDKKSQKEAERQLKHALKFHERNPDIKILYIPIEFDMINDNTNRSMDLEFQKIIDFNLKSILEYSKLPIITLSGSIDERIKTIEKYL